MNPACWPLGWGYWSRIPLTIQLSAAFHLLMPSPSTHGFPLAAPPALPVPFRYPLAGPLDFTREQLTLIHPVRSPRSSMHTVFTRPQGHLENHDRVRAWSADNIHEATSKALSCVWASTFAYYCKVYKSCSNIFVAFNIFNCKCCMLCESLYMLLVQMRSCLCIQQRFGLRSWMWQWLQMQDTYA